MLVLEGLIGLHRTVNFSSFSITGRDIDLDYRDIEWFALETNVDHSVAVVVVAVVVVAVVFWFVICFSIILFFIEG